MQILFADTDDQFLEILQRYFRRHGFVTQVATNETDCTRILHDAQPDVFVLDDALSREVCGRLMEKVPWTSSIPIVFIGDSLDGFDQLTPSPLLAYFRKPFKLDDLLAAITAKTKLAAINASQRSERCSTFRPMRTAEATAK